MLSHDQLLLFWLQLAALLATARILGSGLRRIGQPAVVGELAAGILLGPSVFGQLAPGAQSWLFPSDPVQEGLLAAVGWLGAFLLLIVTGYETDLRLIQRLRRATLRVGLGSLIVPVLAGVAIGYAMPAEFLGPEAERLVFALFLGTALGISALPVIAKVLSDLDLMRRNAAQIIVAAAMAEDLVGWILLGVVVGLAGSGSVDVPGLAITTIGLGAFLLFAFGPGQRLVDAMLRGVRVRRSGAAGAASVIVLSGLAAGALTHGIGLEAVFGAFIAGVVVGRSRHQEQEAFAAIHTLTMSFLAPVFFAQAGLRVDLGLLADPSILRWGLAVLATATVTKFAGAWIGARLAGLPTREALALGAGLNARGAIGIVVATVGLSVGVLGPASYAIVVLLSLATSMMAPPMLRGLLSGWRGSREERERLERERQLGRNVLLRSLPLLLPSHGGPNSVLAARFLDLAWPEDVEAVVLSAGDAPEADVQRVTSAFTRRPVRRETVRARDPLAAILEHAALGYGAIAVGATDARVAGRLISPLVDDLLAASPVPLVMVRRGVGDRSGDDPDLDDASAMPLAIRRILVPAIGTQPGRAAQELAFGLAARLDAEVVIAHVVTVPTPAQELARSGGAPDTHGGSVDGAAAGGGAIEIAERVLEEARLLAKEFGVSARAVIRTGLFAPDVLLGLARDEQIDVLVLAANLRQLSGRPFLGHGVEYLLERSACAVAVVTAPPGFAR